MVQNLFGWAESLLMEGSDSFVHMARRPSEAFLLTDGEVHGSGVPGGPEVKRVEAVERFLWAQWLGPGAGRSKHLCVGFLS